MDSSLVVSVLANWHVKRIACEEGTRFFDTFGCHLQHQVMLILVTVPFHSRRQMAWKHPACSLHDAVGEMRREKPEAIEQRIETAF